MKKVIALSLILMLSGCGLLVNTYDNNEYQLLVDFTIATEEAMVECLSEEENESKEDLHKLLKVMEIKIRRLELYTRYTPKNTDVHEVAKILSKDVDQIRMFYKHNKHNDLYCARKTSMMVDKADAMLKIIPTKKKQ